MLCLVFGLSLLDRTNISNAYIAGMSTDLSLTVGRITLSLIAFRELIKWTDSRYSIALLVFFPCYAIFELPSNLVIRRIGARVWLSFLIVVWGLVVLIMGFVQSWELLAALRALLGIFEAGCEFLEPGLGVLSNVVSIPRIGLHYRFLLQNIWVVSTHIHILYDITSCVRIRRNRKYMLFGEISQIYILLGY